MNIVLAIVGAALLLLGRRLFWLFVAALGFVAGFYLANQFLPTQGSWLFYLVGIVGGVIGALLAVFVQQLAIGLAGFIAGGYGAIYLLQLVGWGSSEFSWLPFIIGGIIGAVLLATIFDWALIVLSSLVGAFLVAQNIPLGNLPETLVTLAFFVIGIILQASLFRRKKEN